MDPLKKIWLNAFARRRFQKFNARLLRRGLMGLGIDDYGTRQERGERRLLEAIASVLPARAVVCDVGAHNGVYANFLAVCRPDLVIHAFEPNPVSFARLAAGAGGRFVAHPFALGDRDGQATLHDLGPDGGSECASLVEGAVAALYRDQASRTVEVPVRTLDGVAAGLDLAAVDYLKIDAEGYDLMVLRGARRLIEENRLGIIQFEFNRLNVFSRTFMHDFYRLLPRHRLHRIVQDGLLALGDYDPVTWELFGYQNIVAAPEDAAKTLMSRAA